VNLLKAAGKSNRRMRSIPRSIGLVLKEIKARLKEVYADNLKGIVLYGSYARGEATEGSDIDLIVLLKVIDEFMVELERCSREVHRIDFRYDTLVSAIPLRERDFKERNLPLILNARREGILL